ncbi:ARHGEF3_8 [Mytilus edulis]|uniref:ARHGEF3_8 n=1 Tax=Mytilus edulis TaxID=6550 RepID=A0A8S3SEH1_MYTED|nr:ARHGEF3_8 [Mytilus edulis]
MPAKENKDENLFKIPEIKDVKSSRRHSIIGLASFDFPVLRKRKRKNADEDTISVQSLDVTVKKKSRKSLLRVSSIANLLSPSKSAKKGSETFQRSISFKVPPSPANKVNVTPYKAPQPSPAKRRLSRTWSDMICTTVGNLPTELSHRDIKRQEAIYELYQSENDLVEDLIIVKKTYHDSLKKLQLLSDGELKQIFGPIDELIPIHEDLCNRLQNQRLPDGTTQCVGELLKEWVPNLHHYISFCANQVFGKALLDEKKNDEAVEDFLQRCQDSPFSRKLDLWTLLDGARGKFVKYPLLMKTIQKYVTVLDEEDNKNLAEAKLHVFLFDEVLVVTRLNSQSGQQTFQVYRQPIPVDQLVVTDLKDGEVKMGSFRSAFGSGQTVKNVFRVSFSEQDKGQSHTLIAADEHDKRQWLICFQKLVNIVSSDAVKTGESKDKLKAPGTEKSKEAKKGT